MNHLNRPGLLSSLCSIDIHSKYLAKSLAKCKMWHKDNLKSGTADLKFLQDLLPDQNERNLSLQLFIHSWRENWWMLAFLDSSSSGLRSGHWFKVFPIETNNITRGIEIKHHSWFHVLIFAYWTLFWERALEILFFNSSFFSMKNCLEYFLSILWFGWLVWFGFFV